ncbi:MAG: VWA domain-containing protein, partial [Planctomycetales bacterium]
VWAPRSTVKFRNVAGESEMDIQIGNPESMNLVFIVAAVVAGMITALVFRRRALAKFATPNVLRRLMPNGSTRRGAIRVTLITAALLALVAALLDVRWGQTWRDVPQKGIEVVFVLDISRSMMAEDVSPSRLDRAKQQIMDMIDEMNGDRAGLVIFAGDVRQYIPLTNNYHDFKLALEEVGPHCVQRGGSRLGDAIRMASSTFLDKTDEHKAIVVITDGEDHESDPVEAAKIALDEKGIRIFTIGLGDMDQGARIPIRLASNNRGYLQHNGEQVWSRMNGEVLKEVALVGDGAYIPAGTKQVDMADVYHGYVSSVEETEFETARINSYIPRYQLFVGLGLALILIDTFCFAGLGRRSSQERIAA